MDIPCAPLMTFGREAGGKAGRPLFLTLGGAHLYGFPSKDSDYDLRGCHVAPLPQGEPAAPDRLLSQPRVKELIALKQAREVGVLEDDTPYVESIRRLQEELESPFAASRLPEMPANVAAINGFLIRVLLE